jgi:hypothetical protein
MLWVDKLPMCFVTREAAEDGHQPLGAYKTTENDGRNAAANPDIAI